MHELLETRDDLIEAEREFTRGIASDFLMAEWARKWGVALIFAARKVIEAGDDGS
jgi:hypothetical protein